ncbi:MAG: helix-turn-helix domain-containing protein [Acidobacteriota bacterium]
MTHRFAITVHDGLAGFEYGIAAEIFGRIRPGLGVEWYSFEPCRVEPGILRTNHGMTIDPPGDLETLEQADTILIPGWRKLSEPPPQDFLDVLCRAHERGARLVTICTGVFVLAHAGLLDGRRVTTHWLHSDALVEAFPKVRLERDALYVHDGRISTSAGSAAGLDLCLAIVREDFGTAVANKVARRMVAPTHREGGQSQYAELCAVVPEDDGFGPVLDWMREHLDEPLALEAIAQASGFTLRTFQRRFRDQTGMSPHRWLSQQRVTRARELLEATDLSIEQVATRSGLGSAANLRKHMARHLQTTPRAYRATFRCEQSHRSAAESRAAIS